MTIKAMLKKLEKDGILFRWKKYPSRQIYALYLTEHHSMSASTEFLENVEYDDLVIELRKRKLNAFNKGDS